MPTTESILFTQCLQNDFTSILDKYDPLPNSLHIGFSEANRLLGSMIEDGPIFSLMDWAYEKNPEDLKLIHIRDWHNADDPKQKDHLTQFGIHCVQNTKGAEFVFQPWIDSIPKRHSIVNASGLNDFVDTELETILQPYSNKKLRVGITGVWTEAKVTFLAYDLKTRYPNFEIAVCSALTASSSLSMHFIALDQLKQILGVQIFSSIGAFTEFLAGDQPSLEKRIISHSRISNEKIKLDPKYPISELDKKIILYLFRDCKEVEFKTLDGGFSGNVVLKSNSIDYLGHKQVPCVIKIGNRDLIAKERMSFERIQEVLGNNAPSIIDFCELEDRGAIKYRYAAMLDGNVRTFQKIYANMERDSDLDAVIDIVFSEQLGRLFDAATLEKLNLLEYYDFQTKYSKSVRMRIEALLGSPANTDYLELLPGVSIYNPCFFYEKDLVNLKEYNAMSHNLSYVHGDLNGANIIIDAQNNVWLIDFFHTHKGHIIRDLLKLENDILFIFCKIESEFELREAMELSKFLIEWEDLGIPPSFEAPKFIINPKLKRAYRVIAKLRSYYPKLVKLDRDPYQMYVGALRYAMHTLSFDESNEYQRKWALFVGATLIQKIKSSIQKTKALRIDFLKPDSENSRFQNLGLTILPGRKDRGRVLAEDVEDIKKEGVTNILSLVTEQELVDYGVSDIKKIFQQNNLDHLQISILDQRVPSFPQLELILDWVEDRIQKKERVMIHCVGGLGRSGTIAAAYLMKKESFRRESAIQKVRESRGERAIESIEQLQFLENWETYIEKSSSHQVKTE